MPFLELISVEEALRIKKKRRPMDQAESLIALMLSHKLIRKMIGKYADFERSEYGKPYVNGNVSFNASHCHSFVAVGAFPNRETLIGIDICHFALDDDVEFLRNSLTDAEWWFVQEDPLDSIRRAYFLWACKEAYIKALGSSIAAIPMNSLEFTVSEETPLDFKITKFRHDDEQLHDYVFYTKWIQRNIILAICASEETVLDGMDIRLLNEEELMTVVTEPV
jgi:phosphopantetheinyl transferase